MDLTKISQDREAVEGRTTVPLADAAKPHENAVHKEPADDSSATRKSGTSTENLARSASGCRYPAGGVPAEGSGVHAEYDGNGARTCGNETSPEPSASTQPLDATRELQTFSGTLTYTAVSEHLAVNIVHCLDALFDANPDDICITPDWISNIHHQLAGELFPDWGGQFRKTDVQVGSHLPPPAHDVMVQVKNFCLDLEERQRHLADVQSIAELLAWVDWRFQWIHPFKDFNGRVGRILLVALTYKLGLPPADPAAIEQGEVQRSAYFSALRRADEGDLSWLREIWLHRLAT